MRKSKDGTYQPTTKKIPDLTTYSESFGENKYEITNKDYKEVIEKYRYDPDAFIYLDPPYVSRGSSNAYVSVDENYTDHIEEIMKDPKTKASIMVHLDFTGDNYHKFKDFIKSYYPFKFNIRKHKARHYQMIACNYEVPEE